jgi:hypothetical protein
MKTMSFIFLFFVLSAQKIYSQNTLDKAGLTSSTPAQVAFSLRNMSSTYTGPAIKVRRSLDNAEADVAFDASGGLTAASLVTFTAGVTVGAAFGTSQSGTITSAINKTGTITISVNKTGTITTSNGSSTVTGVGTSFTTDLIVGSLMFNASNVFLGVVSSITNNTTLLLSNYATIVASAVNYKTSTASVTGTGTNFTTELVVGDRIFNGSNSYLGTVAAIVSSTSMTLNAVDAVAATAITYKGTIATITGVGTSFTSLNPGDLLVSNNITIGIISSIASATSLTLTTKAGAAISGLAYKSTTGTIAFSTYYSATSVYVNTWYDQSGFSRNAIQLKPANQARIVNAGVLYIVNGRTALEFSNALSAFLETSTVAGYLDNTLYTLNNITAEASINPNLQLPISTTGGNGPDNTISHYGYRSSSQFTVAQYGNDQNFNASPSTSLELHTAVKISTASSEFYKNGISLGVLTSGAPSNLSNVGLLHIGYYTPTVSYYNGSISELTVFSIALGITDINLLDNNQLAYYNIASTFWTGAISTVWTDPGNWSTGVVPTISSPSIVVIPAGKPRYPIISTISPANSISLEAATSLTITGTLQLAGTINNLGTCTASSGTVQYTGSAPQTITTGTFAGNIIQNVIINNSTGVALSGNIAVSGNLSFTAGKLSIGSFTLTIEGTVTNTIAGGLTGSSNSLLIVNGTVSPTLSFDQTTAGTTNSLKSLTVNSVGHIVTLSNNLMMVGTGTTTFTAGKLAIGSTTLTIRGLVVNTVTDGLVGSINSNVIVDGTLSPTLSFDQTTPGTTNVLSTLTLNCPGQIVSLSRPLVINSSLTITTGTLYDAGSQISSTGTLNLTGGTLKLGSPTVATIWPAFTINNISAGGTVEYAAGVSQIVSGTPAYQNLTISATGGTTAANDLNVNNVLNLSAANPSTTIGSLSMSTFTLNMGSLATTTGTGDVTGIVKRTTVLPNVTYTMGNSYSSIIFPSVGTLPTQISMKIVIGAAPLWKPLAIQRVYDFIQTGGSGTKAVISAHYLDGELNGNVENNLVDFSFRFAGSILTEHGKSNSNSTQNWIVLSNVDVAFFSSGFGNIQLTLANSALTTLTWNGSTSTSWITATNWTPNGGPSTNTILIVPDASTTPNDPSMPATASNGSLTIQSGGIVNSDPGAQLILNNAGLVWSNSGTFNAGTSTIFFSNASSTMNGTTNFNNVTINSGAELLMSTNNIMRIAGTMTNNGTWTTDLLTNTVEYNGSNQTILVPNGSSGSYYNLIVSGTGTNILPASSLNILGDLSLDATVSTTGNTISMNGAIPQNINGTAPLTLNNLTVNNTSGPVSLNQNVNVTSALTFTGGNLAIGTNTLTLSGTVVNTVPNGIIGSLTSNLVLNGSVSPAISFDQSSPGISDALNNLTINSSGQIIGLNSNLEVNGNLLFNAGKLAINANTLNIKNNLTNTVTGGLQGSSSSNLIISGGAVSPSLSFDQTTPGLTNLLNNFTMSSNSQNAVLTNPVIINNSLNLADGNVVTTTANSLTLAATAGFTGGANNSFIDGPLIRNTSSTADYIFPVGKTGTYFPITVSPVSATAGVYTAEYFPLTPPVGIISPVLIGIATDAYWNINKTSGPDAFVTLNYQDVNTWTPGSPTSLDLIVVAGLNAGNWTPQNGDAIPGNTGSGVTAVKTKLQSAYSSFTFGFGQSVSLPLTLLSFTGVRNNPVVNLKWIASGEITVSRFEIERSMNQLQFTQIGITAAINSSLNITYNWTDQAPAEGKSFYRLKMIDQDGVFTYSNIIEIDINPDNNEISIYPNPVTGNSLNLLMNGQPKGEYVVGIYNNIGERVMISTIIHDGSNSVKTIPLNRLPQPGTYYMEVIGPGNKSKTFKLLFN